MSSLFLAPNIGEVATEGGGEVLQNSGCTTREVEAGQPRLAVSGGPGSAAFQHLLGWWLEELADAILRPIWIRYHDARHAGDEQRAAVIFGRFVRLVDRFDWGCRIEFWKNGQLIITGPQRPAAEGYEMDEWDDLGRYEQ
jgi:hypothetical protein